MFLKLIFFFLIPLVSSSISLSEETFFIGEFTQGGVIIGKNSMAEKFFFENEEL